MWRCEREWVRPDNHGRICGALFPKSSQARLVRAGAAQKIAAKIKTGKISTDALAKIIAGEFEELKG